MSKCIRDFTVIETAAVGHLGLKFEITDDSVRRRSVRTVPNFIAISHIDTKVSRFFDFQDGDRPPS